MRAILPQPSGGFGLSEIPPPAIGPGEILLEMRACGLCGTDLAKLAQPDHAQGVRLGHEVAGIVPRLDSEYENLAAVRDRVELLRGEPPG